MRNNLDGNDPFATFFLGKLRPEIEHVKRNRRGALFRSLLTAACAFIVFFIAMFLFLTPYYQMLSEYEISYVPLMVLLPLTMAVICFSLVYIFSLRAVVKNFREKLIAQFAEFIDPGLTHKPDSAIPEQQLRQSLLFENLGAPSSGPDRFVGRRGNASYEFAEIRVEDSPHGALEGIYFTAAFDRRLPALLVVLTADQPISLNGMEEKLKEAGVPHADELSRLEVPNYPLQLITRLHDQDTARKLLSAVFTPELLVYCHQRRLDPYLSCLGDKLSIALLKRADLADGKEKQPVFDTFNFARCREFCHDASMCLAVSDELARNMAIWEARVN